MRRRAFLVGLAIALTASRVGAQAPSRVVRIGVLSFGSAPAPGAPDEPIVRHLRALGYLEANNVIFARRYAGGVRERYPELAAELLRSKVEVIFAPGSDVARAFRDAAPTVPVVFVVSDDPVATGLVQSIAQSTATRCSVGSVILRYSSRFPPSSGDINEIPVKRPPGMTRGTSSISRRCAFPLRNWA
jgi:putative ABC transport system substrate-binding protein